MVMATTSLADAKSQLSKYVQAAEQWHERTIITKNGVPVAVIISVDELESIDMTLEFTNDPELMAEIRGAEAEVGAGQVYTVEEAKAALAERQGKRA